MTFTCSKCNGSGQIAAFRHIENGACFLCGGSGKLARRPRIAADPHPDLLVSEANRSTDAQWDYLVRLCNDRDDLICRVLKDAGAPMATQRYITKAVMSKAIETAKAGA